MSIIPQNVNFQAGLGLPSGEFRDWWEDQPRQDYGVDVWSDEYEFVKPNVFTIEQVQELYYYFKSITLIPPAITTYHQYYWDYIIDNQYWVLEYLEDGSVNPEYAEQYYSTPFEGANTYLHEYYYVTPDAPGSIKYYGEPQPPGSEDGMQPDGTWVQNGYWFNRVPYEYANNDVGHFLIPVFSEKRYVQSDDDSKSQSSSFFQTAPYTVEYNRTFQQRMKPVCIDNTYWSLFYDGDNSNGDGTPGNALKEELGNPGSGCFYENPNHKRFHEFEETIYQNPFHNAGGFETIKFRTKHLRETTIMGNIHFYCLGRNPEDNKIYWTISSQEPQYNVDTNISSYGDSDFVTGRYYMGYSNWTTGNWEVDPQFFFARTSLKTFWSNNEENFVEDNWGFGGITLWIPDATCDIDTIAAENNDMVKRIDVQISPKVSITFLQEKQFENCFFPHSPGPESDVPDNPAPGLNFGEDYMNDFESGDQRWFNFNYDRTINSQSYINVNNDWQITNPTMTD